MTGVIPATALAPAIHWVEGRSFDEAQLPAIAAAIARSVPGFLTSNAPAGRLFVLPSLESAAPAVPDTLRFRGIGLPRRLVDDVVSGALATRTDPVYLMALADKESGFQPAVKARTSSAEGLYQFIESTWLEIMRDTGHRYGLGPAAEAIGTAGEKPVVTDPEQRSAILDLRREPRVAAIMAGELLKRYRAEVGFRIGRDLTVGELYMAHFLGPNDAARLLELRMRSPKASAATNFPAPAKANTAIFYARKGRRLKPLSVAEVYDRIDRMIATRVSRYADLASALGTLGQTASAAD